MPQSHGTLMIAVNSIGGNGWMGMCTAGVGVGPGVGAAVGGGVGVCVGLGVLVGRVVAICVANAGAVAEGGTMVAGGGASETTGTLLRSPVTATMAASTHPA